MVMTPERRAEIQRHIEARADSPQVFAWGDFEMADLLAALAQVEGQLATARETATRLNRRCQSAEAALDMRVEDWHKRGKDAIRNHYWARAERAEADLARVRELVEQALCSHEHRTGGNDYLLCENCGLMWDYRRETPAERIKANLVAALTGTERREEPAR